jgi:hypothetical protein
MTTFLNVNMALLSGEPFREWPGTSSFKEVGSD